MKWLKCPKNTRGLIKVNVFQYIYSLRLKYDLARKIKYEKWKVTTNIYLKFLILIKNFKMSNIGSKI